MRSSERDPISPDGNNLPKSSQLHGYRPVRTDVDSGNKITKRARKYPLTW